jgi:hypothetical protein
LDNEPAEGGDRLGKPLGQALPGEGQRGGVELVEPAVAFAGARERPQPALPQVIEVLIGKLDPLGIPRALQPEVGEGTG